MSLEMLNNFALSRLLSLGMDAQWLIDNHASQLKSIRLKSDMGTIDVPRNEENTDDVLDLMSVAEFVIKEACAWPYRDEIHGIDIEPAMKLAAVDYLTHHRFFHLKFDNSMSRSSAYGIASAFDDGLTRLKKITDLPESVYLAGLSRNGLQLNEVPLANVTPEINIAAVKSNGNAIQHVGKEFRTPELIKLAVESSGSALAYLGEDEITTEIADIAVNTTPWVVSYVPSSMMTRSLLYKAVSSDGMLLDELPSALVDRKVAQVCIKQTPLALLVCPERFLDANMLRFACRHHPEIKKEQWVKDISSNLLKPLPVMGQ